MGLEEMSRERFSFLFQYTSRLFKFSTMRINSRTACIILKHCWDPEPDLLGKTEMSPCRVESIAIDMGKMPAAPQPAPSGRVTLSRNQP